MDRKQYAEYEEAYRKGTEGFSIVAHECGEDGCDEFSWRHCEICHSRLGGPRHNMTLTNPGPADESYSVKACSDCLYYSEYGQLNDMTMQEIADSLEEPEDPHAHVGCAECIADNYPNG